VVLTGVKSLLDPMSFFYRLWNSDSNSGVHQIRCVDIVIDDCIDLTSSKCGSSLGVKPQNGFKFPSGHLETTPMTP
jgi:hypothetical protein